jgi:DNA-binding transcriptional MerR regulator
MYFKIGEVSEIAGIKPHVLRYWESEFKVAKPMRSKAQQRVYRRSDLEKILLIKTLLYEDKYSIAGAKKKLREIIKHKKHEETKAEQVASPDQIEFCFDEKTVKKKLKEIKNLLISLKESL